MFSGDTPYRCLRAFHAASMSAYRFFSVGVPIEDETKNQSVIKKKPISNQIAIKNNPKTPKKPKKEERLTCAQK